MEDEKVVCGSKGLRFIIKEEYGFSDVEEYGFSDVEKYGFSEEGTSEFSIIRLR